VFEAEDFGAEFTPELRSKRNACALVWLGLKSEFFDSL
jgi:hypothetical protein